VDNISHIANSIPGLSRMITYLPTNHFSWVHGLMDTMNYLHNFTGLPWWATLSLFCICARVALLPIAVINSRHGSRSAHMKLELEPLMKEHREKQSRAIESGTIYDNVAFQVSMSNLTKKYKTNPAYLFIQPVVAITFFVSNFAAMRALGEINPTFLTEPCFWVISNAAVDSTFLFPFISAGTMLATTWLSPPIETMNPQTQIIMTRVMSVMAILSIPFSGYLMPSVMFVYWSTNNLFTLFQHHLFSFAWFRKLFNIGELPKYVPSNKPDPIHQMYNSFTTLFNPNNPMDKQQILRNLATSLANTTTNKQNIPPTDTNIHASNLSNSTSSPTSSSSSSTSSSASNSNSSPVSRSRKHSSVYSRPSGSSAEKRSKK
jgi:YidC/Oxa1 family membrane protein insertase